jgi:hypothetical protein
MTGIFVKNGYHGHGTAGEEDVFIQKMFLDEQCHPNR